MTPRVAVWSINQATPRLTQGRLAVGRSTGRAERDDTVLGGSAYTMAVSGGVQCVCRCVLLCGASVGEVWDAKRPANSCKLPDGAILLATRYGAGPMSNPKMCAGEPPGTRTLNPLMKS
jgi:hypothetical protein